LLSSVSSINQMLIRKLASHEIDLHRDLRLRALSGSPNSFGETYEAVASLSPADWERRTAHVTNDDSGTMFIASIGDTTCGCAYGLADVQRAGGGRVGGMWVDPAHRRLGVGSALLQAVLEWAGEMRFDSIGLWAPAHEEGAIALYTRAGFRETGRARPLPANVSFTIIEMELSKC
jgi:GNAT superfamily N-acetyltransferase